ncbi:PucR family transcriptional regulator [Streptomyces sp. NPDC002125]
MDLADRRDTSARPRAGVALPLLVAYLGVPVAQAGGSTDDDVAQVVIAAPGEALGPVPGALVLVAGARGAAAVAAVGAAGAAGAVAVAVRVGPEGLTEGVRAAAMGAGVSVLGVPDGLRWDQVEARVRGLLDSGATQPADRSGDLFSLAQTVVTLTHGVVAVEDNAHRIVAYAGSGEEADAFRRESILGRACPEEFLALLREWGVYRQARAGEEVIEVPDRPDLGVRRRLVIGINAGSRPLGTIWVQEGRRPLSDRTGDVLRGAARLAVPQMVDHYYRGDSTARLPARADLAHGLLTGRFNSVALGTQLGIAPAASASVVAVDLRDPDDGDTAWHDARRAEAAQIVSVHAAAYRTNAVVAQACGQIYAILPGPAGHTDEAPLLRWAADLVATLRRHHRTPVQAAVAGTAQRLDGIPSVKLRGYHALQVMARTPDRAVDSHSRLTASLMVRDLLEVLESHREIRHPGLEALVAHDAENGTELASSLLAYLNGFGDVTRVAKSLNVHPNTLRYRVRKASERTGLDLDDPEDRLAAMLQLRLLGGTGETGPSPFPAR